MRPPVFITLRLPRAWLLVLALGSITLLLAWGASVVHAPHPSQPPGPLAGRRIVVDAGHGGIDAGCFHGDLKEKDINLAVARRLAQLLKRERAEVRLTREEDTALDHLNNRTTSRHRRDLWARVDIAQEHRAELLVSIHTNYARSPALKGAVTFYRPGLAEGRRLAQALQKRLASVAPGNQNAVLSGDFFLLRNLAIPAALVEIGFLSNPEERSRLVDPTYQDRLAEALLQGILDYYRQPAPDHPPAPAPPSVTPAEGEVPPELDEHSCSPGS